MQSDAIRRPAVRDVDLVSFAAPSLRRLFEETAARCGVSTHEIPCARGMPAERPAGTGLGMVLLVDGETSEDTVFESAGRLLRDRPCLGVFHAPCAGSRVRLASRCSDFLMWPASADELAMRLDRILDARDGGCGSGEARDLAAEFAAFQLVGVSPAYLTMLGQVRRYARCDATVLVQGPTGTGKELVARAIHYMSARRDGPFIPVNCGAIPETLVESELFGHERGAFTDARQRQAGVVEQARGGTLFLDEVDALPARAQVALLRVLQDGEYRPLGARGPAWADLRVVAACNSNLHEQVEQGVFRDDLFFRLNILAISVPPLRQRPEDIEPLSQRLLARLQSRYGGTRKVLHPRTLEWMQRYEWPGNVRELENVLHRGYVITDGPVMSLGPEDLCIDVADPGHAGPASASVCAPTDGPFCDAKARAIEQFERLYLCRLMSDAGGNVSRAARCAGKERRALGKLLKKHGIDPRAF